MFVGDKQPNKVSQEPTQVDDPFVMFHNSAENIRQDCKPFPATKRDSLSLQNWDYKK